MQLWISGLLQTNRDLPEHDALSGIDQVCLILCVNNNYPVCACMCVDKKYVLFE